MRIKKTARLDSWMVGMECRETSELGWDFGVVLPSTQHLAVHVAMTKEILGVGLSESGGVVGHRRRDTSMD